MATVTAEPASAAKVDIPVQGMTCAACQASVQQALQRQPGVVDASVNLMMKNAAVSYDPAVTRPEALVEAIRDTGYDAELPRAEQTAFEEQEARDRAQEEEFRALRLKALASLAAGAVAMIVSMPLDGHGRAPRPGGRSVHALGHGVPDPGAAGGDAVAVCDQPGCPLLRPALPHARRDGLGRAALLHPRLGGLPPSLGGHEHPGRRGHGRGVPLLRARHGRRPGSSSPGGWRPTSTTRRWSSSSP